MFFFDVDNTLYDENKGIQKAAGERIIRYFAKIGLTDAKVAHELSQKYYLQYGLSVRGLIKHHKVDPVDYDKFVDGGLPLEDLLTPSQELKDMLHRLKTDRWIFTNAGHLHARRVLTNLDIVDQFSGMTYCDYAHEDFHCKPEAEFFQIAMRDAKVTKDTKCFFVDDSKQNCERAKSLGWTVVHITQEPESSTCADFAVRRVTELPRVLPELFEPDSHQAK